MGGGEPAAPFFVNRLAPRCRGTMFGLMSVTSKPLPRPELVRYLIFAASLRTASLNTRLAVLAQKAIAAHKGTVDPAAMRDFDCPSYSQEAQAKGFPPGAEALRRRLDANDAFVIASPEYNGSMPGALKNVIDWVSRFRPALQRQARAALVRVPIDGRR